jgi:2-dehydropantoate 2-reductase
MRIAVIGTGGIGGPYGASLAKAGADVTFVARGAHLAAICENGLRIEGDRGETHIWPARATDDIVSIGTVDVVLPASNCGTSKMSPSRSARSLGCKLR